MPYLVKIGVVSAHVTPTLVRLLVPIVSVRLSSILQYETRSASLYSELLISSCGPGGGAVGDGEREIEEDSLDEGLKLILLEGLGLSEEEALSETEGESDSELEGEVDEEGDSELETESETEEEREIEDEGESDSEAEGERDGEVEVRSGAREYSLNQKSQPAPIDIQELAASWYTPSPLA